MVISFLDLVICTSGLGTIEAMTEPHIREHGGTNLDIGLTFFIMGACYSITVIILGCISGYIKNQTLVSIAGNIFSIVGISFMGPLPFIPLKPNINTIKIAIGFIGLGLGCIMISTFSRSHKYAVRYGFSDGFGTYLFISGLWSACYYFGNFIGPTIAGFIVTSYGYRIMTIFYGITYIIALISDIGVLVLFKKLKATK